jgi:protease IV
MSVNIMSKTLQMFQQLSINLLNMQRQRYKAIDYVMIDVPTQFPIIPEDRNLIQRQVLGEPAMSLLEFEQNLERIGDDPRPIGVILYLRGIAVSLADLQTIRDAISRLREKGKRVISYSARYDTRSYYLASACDEILMLPGGMLDTTGILSQQVFLKDGLDVVGLKLDSVAISPFKGAMDTYTRTEPSDEGREQINWLLDSTFNMILDGVAATRKMKPDAVKKMIDTSPHLGDNALEKGYIDGIMNEERLIDYLGITKITPWEEADQQIYLPIKDQSQKYVAVLYAGGMIVDGESAKPPAESPVPIPFVGGERLGDMTLNQQVRNLMQDDKCGALVLYIDSGGGSASASESMASTLAEFAKTRPFVVYMGGVAASGGYYIATPADWIVAQAGTITGSIGVIMGKLVNNELLQKLRFNAVSYMRGKNADIVSSDSAFSDAQRKQIRDSIEHIYDQFIARVARSRGKTIEEIDAIGGGRVWTGEQALENGLIDEIGNLRSAIKKARELANLPDDAPSTLVRDKGKPIGAQLAQQNPAAFAKYVIDNVESITNRTQYLLPFDWRDN